MAAEGGGGMMEDGDDDNDENKDDKKLIHFIFTHLVCSCSVDLIIRSCHATNAVQQDIKHVSRRCIDRVERIRRFFQVIGIIR